MREVPAASPPHPRPTRLTTLQVGDGDKTSADLISSGPDSPDKNFLPLLNPWALPVNPTPTTGRK